MQFSKFLYELNDFTGSYISFPGFNNPSIKSYFADQKKSIIQDCYNGSKTKSYTSSEISNFLKLSVFEFLVCDFLFKTLLHNEKIMFVDYGSKASDKTSRSDVTLLGSSRVVDSVFHIDIIETHKDLENHLISDINIRAIIYSGITSSDDYKRTMETILRFGSLPFLLMGSVPISARCDIQQYNDKLESNHSMMYLPLYSRGSIASRLSAMLWYYSFKEKRVYSFSQRILLKLWRKYSSEIFICYSN